MHWIMELLVRHQVCSCLLCVLCLNWWPKPIVVGWLAWERFRCVTDCKTYPTSCISETLFTEMADQLVTLGLRVCIMRAT